MFDPKDEGQRSVFYEGLMHRYLGASPLRDDRVLSASPTKPQSSLRLVPTGDARLAREDGR
jgi:hypothetical protein